MMNPVAPSTWIPATLLLTGVFLLFPGAGTGAGEEERPTSKLFGERSLRGFGVVTADYGESAAGDVSWFRARAQSPEKAALLHAKFLDDLTRTTGAARITPREINGPDGAFTAHAGPDGSLLVAVRDDAGMHVVYGADETRLLSALTRLPRPPTLANTRSALEVPMYLNLWTQYAFRFYYSRPGETPDGQDPETYDPDTEFAFADQLGKFGVVFWLESQNAAMAPGQTNETLWNWAHRLAARRQLPIILNLSLVNANAVANAYREEYTGKAPHFSGSFRSVGETGFGGQPFLSWASQTARAAELRTLQKMLVKYNTPEVVQILDPDMELAHGDSEMLTEYGPHADATFRAFLQERHGPLAAVSLRHHGVPDAYADWDDIHLPELAEFAGWGPEALDLSGAWRLGYPDFTPDPDRRPEYHTADHGVAYPVEPPPAAWYNRDFDDSAWPKIDRMPGSDESMFLPKRPAVLRRHFTLNRRPREKVWLYLWDLNHARGDTYEIHLNGHAVADGAMRPLHWGAWEVGDFLEAGDNTLALRLPKGMIGYRIYLSREEPKSYPHLGPGKNALWVDFIGWRLWARARAVEMALSTIRQVEPDKSIVMMTGERFLNEMRELARHYGANFHDTGAMAGMHYEFNSMIMRGADLPISCEPGGRAESVQELQRAVGFWLSSGTNAISYFMHLTDIAWRPEIRAYVQRIAPVLTQIGRHRQAKSDVAILFDATINELTGYPWNHNANASFPSGLTPWIFNEQVLYDYPMDGLIPADFANGLADPYKIVFDANNTIMTPETVNAIRGWVERGGIFVAMTQTGRHLPEEPDTWPARELTGYAGEVFTRYNEWADTATGDQALAPAREQSVFRIPALLAGWRAYGTSLHPVARDTEPLFRWEDGSVAIGQRRIGAGQVITVGPRMHPSQRWSSDMIKDLARHAGARQLELLASWPLYATHTLSLNGLFDVWTFWNHEDRRNTPYRFAFRDGRPRELTDILTGEPAAVEGELPPREFIMAYSPRPDPQRAADRWFTFLAGDWQGTAAPAMPLDDTPEPHTRYTLDLNTDWRIQPLADDADPVAALAADDAPWQAIDFGPWIQDEMPGKRFIMKRAFVIPEDWTRGRLHLWLPRLTQSFHDIEIFLDGEAIANPAPHWGVYHFPLDLAAGRTATLGIEVNNRGERVGGVRMPVYLTFIPAPDEEIDLEGEWRMRYHINDATPGTAFLPGKFDGPYVTRNFHLPEMPADGRTFLLLDAIEDVSGVIVNGRFVRSRSVFFGDIAWMDITPWVEPGEENEITLAGGSFGHFDHWAKEVKLFLYHQPVFDSPRPADE